MRCRACNKALNDFESTRKSIETGEYLDLCNHCFQASEIGNSKEREDLRDVTDDEDLEDPRHEYDSEY
jgi:hypothetical protein